MVSHEFLKAPDDVVVLSGQTEVAATVAAALNGRTVHATPDVDKLLAIVVARRVRTIVIDRDDVGARDALRRVSALPMRPSMFVIQVVRDPISEILAGTDLVVVERGLADAVALANLANAVQDRPLALDRLLGVSMLGRSLDLALETAADDLAAGFGVDRVLISVREDSTRGAASGTGTWSSLAWSYTAERCRAAASGATPLVAPLPENPHAPCETFLAVPLETSLGTNGFLGLVSARPRRFSAAMREALGVVANRLAAEVGWRGAHERANDELERLSSGPGLDVLLGIWNATALKQLAAMQLSSAIRSKLSLGVAVLDVVDLQGINHRHGHEVGDRVLRRIADMVRTTVREEDVVGRWSGDAVAVILHGVGPEGCQRAAERLRDALAQRPLELAGSESLAIPVTIGIASCQTDEGAVQLITRAAGAALKAQHAGDPISHAGAPITNPRLHQSGEIQLISEDIASTIGGTYRLLHEISRGGMGVVYRAQDRALERPVAIKMLRPDLAEDPELVERFRFEASLLAHIRHPNLVQIYSFGHTGGDSYFVMELVEGESLEQAFERYISERSSMPLGEMPHVITQIASALDALHERGIVHRDVKPANVIRDPFRNRSVLVDVGIARRYGQNGSNAGTPGFVAPEIFGGADATARSDVYGLAATAYTMLTLKRPWGDGDLSTLLARQCANELRLPSELRPELAPVDDVFLRALDPDPERRQATAGTFAKELVAGLPVILPRERNGGEPNRAPRKTFGSTEGPRARGVVFRAVPRALGMREAERVREAISDLDPELARALAESAPLSWVPTPVLLRLFAIIPDRVGRDRVAFARDLAKVTIRASFRRFFPASAATLVPESTLSAIRNVWSRYHSWGFISSMPVHPTEHVVKIGATLRDPLMCAWTAGMLEQLVVLSGAKRVSVQHDDCQADGHEACLFKVGWQRAED